MSAVDSVFSLIKGGFEAIKDAINMARGHKTEASAVKLGSKVWGVGLGGIIGGLIGTFLLPGLGTVAGVLAGAGLGVEAGSAIGSAVTHLVPFDIEAKAVTVSNGTHSKSQVHSNRYILNNLPKHAKSQVATVSGQTITPHSYDFKLLERRSQKVVADYQTSFAQNQAQPPALHVVSPKPRHK